MRMLVLLCAVWAAAGDTEINFNFEGVLGGTAASSSCARCSDARLLSWRVGAGASLDGLLGAADAQEAAQQASLLVGRAGGSAAQLRMDSVASQLVEAGGAHLLALQQLASWSVEEASQDALRVDTLQLLLRSLLLNHNLSYAVASRIDGLGIPRTMYAPGSFASLQFSHALLVRSDVAWSRPRSGRFSSLYARQSALLGDVSFPRSWLSVDFSLGAKSARFFSAQLEAAAPEFRLEQARELTALVNEARASGVSRIVVAGELYEDGARVLLEDASLDDAWLRAGVGSSGLTAAHDELLEDPQAELTSRADYIAARGLSSFETTVTLDEQLDGEIKWASDHAGVLAFVQL